MRQKKKKVEPQVIHQDQTILVLAKPASMVTTRAKTVKGKTVQDWLKKNFKFQISNFKLYRSGIVHRLDKETSGLLLVAKTEKALSHLQKQFKERKVKKQYLALVRGKIEPPEGEITLPLGRMRKDRERFTVRVEGRRAKTKYERVRFYQKGKKSFSLLILKPITGRTHQLRAHLSFLGHPVVADLKYGGQPAGEERKWSPRLFLHASFLGFVHPQSRKWVEFSLPLPRELKRALKFLEK